jgi:hypothetical protein
MTSDDDARVELQELIESHLSRGKPDDVVIGIVCYGVSRVGEGIQHLQAQSVSWGAALGCVRSGAEAIRQGLPLLRTRQAELAGLIRFGERQLAFAELLEKEIVRLQADQSTPA